MSYSMIGFAKKAGKLIAGYDPVKRALEDGVVERVYLAKDLSEKTAGNMRYLCENVGAEAIEADFTMDDVAAYIHKKVGVIALTDRHMDNSLSAACKGRKASETEE